MDKKAPCCQRSTASACCRCIWVTHGSMLSALYKVVSIVLFPPQSLVSLQHSKSTVELFLCLLAWNIFLIYSGPQGPSFIPLRRCTAAWQPNPWEFLGFLALCVDRRDGGKSGWCPGVRSTLCSILCCGHISPALSLLCCVDGLFSASTVIPPWRSRLSYGLHWPRINQHLSGYGFPFKETLTCMETGCHWGLVLS